MKILANERGVALITALSLGLIGSLFVVALWSLVRQEVSTVYDVNAYASERDAAKGIAEILMVEMNAGTMTCGSNNICKEKYTSGGGTIDLDDALCQAVNKTDCTTITATYKGASSQTEYQFFNGTQIAKTTTLETISITSQNELSLDAASPQQAIIDIVYQSEYSPENWIE